MNEGSYLLCNSILFIYNLGRNMEFASPCSPITQTHYFYYVLYCFFNQIKTHWDQNLSYVINQLFTRLSVL